MNPYNLQKENEMEQREEVYILPNDWELLGLPSEIRISFPKFPKFPKPKIIQQVQQATSQAAQSIGISQSQQQQAQQAAQQVQQQAQQAAQQAAQQVQQQAQQAAQQAQQQFMQFTQSQAIPASVQQAKQLAIQWAQSQGIPTNSEQVKKMAVAKATQVIMQKAKEQGIPLTPLQAQQMAIEELLKQPWIQETGIGDMYNQIKNIQQMFKPCPVPPGFMFHDNLIRRISIFGQSYELKIRICYPISAHEQIQRVINHCNNQATQAAIQYGGAALATGSFTFGASIPAAFTAALNAYQNRFLTCLQSPQNLGIQFSIFIQ